LLRSTSASASAVSSSTSSVPALTKVPSSNPILTTRPVTSGLRMTDSHERRLPIASASLRRRPTRTVCASTGTAKPPGGPAGPAVRFGCANSQTLPASSAIASAPPTE
jgi:hypothetical protein